MGGKKKVEEVKKQILGRASNTLKMGLVGLPNVGKSTTFNFLSKLHVAAENFPFCTIEPTNAKIGVPDKRFNRLCEIFNPKSKVLAQISITDIAGLVKGASAGEGLGNAFLSHISAVDGIYHVVRAFPDEEVTHVDGDLDPVRDIDVISSELRAKDVVQCERAIEDLNGQLKRAGGNPNKSQLELEMVVLTTVLKMVMDGQDVRSGDWSGKDIEFLNKHLFLTSKPVIYLVNIGRDQYIKQKNPWLPKIQEHIKKIGGGAMIPYSAEFESEVISGCTNPDDREEQAKVAAELGQKSMIDRIIKAGYKNLQLIHYFTAGEDEVKCWTIRDGTKAPGAAGVIHTDFERGFICAETMKFEDLDRLGTTQDVKDEGLYRQQGKEYMVLDGDIMLFKFNVTTSKKK